MTTGAIVFAMVHGDLEECTCTHGDHTICPMHHRSPASGTRCAMRAAHDSNTVGFPSVFSIAGIIAPTAASAVPTPATVAVPFDLVRPAFRPSSPDPPPPRA
jgi:hypothetical protein